MNDLFQRSSLSLLLILPLNQPGGWHWLKFNNIPENQARFTVAGLQLEVNQSAGPLVYSLPQTVAVRRITVKGRYTGELRVPPGRQGEKGCDDYVLRIGLIEPGHRTLNLLQRHTVPEWVRTLSSLLPETGGITGIQCFNVGNDPASIGQSRTHPLNQLIHESVVAVPDKRGRLDFTFNLPHSVNTSAVWISGDGDDTQSSFKVTLEKIEFELSQSRSITPHVDDTQRR